MSSSSTTQEFEASSSSNERVPLLSINVYCLLNICKYLNLLDIINLAFTCYGLRFIINSSVLPKFSKSLKLYLTSATSPIFDVNSSAMSVSELKAHILQIGNFVEHLSVTSVHEDQFLPVTWQHFEYILQKCPIFTKRFVYTVLNSRQIAWIVSQRNWKVFICRVLSVVKIGLNSWEDFQN